MVHVQDREGAQQQHPGHERAYKRGSTSLCRGETTTEGLTKRERTALSLASSILIAVGVISIPAGVHPAVGGALAVIGAIGFGIRQALGEKKA
jgi:hypothetical protein